MANGKLEPSTVATIDQAYQGAKEYIGQSKEEIRRFKERFPDVTQTELIYMLFDSFSIVMTPEQITMTFIVSLLENGTD